MTVAQGVWAFFRTRRTFGNAGSAMQSNKPPLVCASASRVRWNDDADFKSLLCLAAFKLSRVPPGTQSGRCRINAKISSLIAGTRFGKSSALTLLARPRLARWPSSPKPVMSVAARTSFFSASSAPITFVCDMSAITFFSREREARPRLIAVVAMPVPRGFVKTSKSPTRAFAFVKMFRRSTTPVTARP